jgi:hypothetical protein
VEERERKTRSTDSIAKCFSDDVVTVVLITAGHALAGEGVGGIVTLKLGAALACCRGGISEQARRPKSELSQGV